MMLEFSGGGGGLTAVHVSEVSGLPSLSRHFVPAGMVMVILPSGDVAVNVSSSMPLLSSLKTDRVPKKFVTTVIVVVPPPPPPPDIVADRGNCVVSPLCRAAVCPVETPLTSKVR